MARECFARAATPRPAMGDVVARVEALLEADYARGASAEQRLAKVEAAIEAEEASDRAAYKEAEMLHDRVGRVDRRFVEAQREPRRDVCGDAAARGARKRRAGRRARFLAAEVGESVHATLPSRDGGRWHV